MLLRFLGENECSGPAGEGCPFVVGEVYEVAEIFEYPWHVMARMPGDSRWPRPGDAMFSWHPEFFERTDQPLPILSWGYSYRDDMSSCFGVVIDDVDDVAKIRRYEKASDRIYQMVPHSWPIEEECFTAWHERIGRPYSSALGRCLYRLERHEIGVPAVSIHDDVFLPDAEIQLPFATVTYSTDEMVKYNVSCAQANRHIGSLLHALSIAPRKAGIPAISWWSYGEFPRLINAPGCPEMYHRQDRRIEGVCPQCGLPYQSDR